MSIIIPSNKIYGDIDNNKILDNKITKVFIKQNDLTINPEYIQANSYETVDVFKEGIFENGVIDNEKKIKNVRIIQWVSVEQYIEFYFQIRYFEYNVNIGSISDNKTEKNILKNSKFSVQQTAKDKSSEENANYTISSSVFVYEYETEEDGFPLIDIFTHSADANTNVVFVENYTSSKASGFIAYYGGFKQSNGEDERLVKTAGLTISVKNTLNSSYVDFSIPNETPKDYYPITLETNELSQTQNSINNAPNYQILSQNVINAYKNGKETAEFLCEIGEYYNEQGELVISTEKEGLPMTFNHGDIVKPMVYDYTGEDVPMSRNKEFKVLGVKFIYDGASWQKLTIQEL